MRASVTGKYQAFRPTLGPAPALCRPQSQKSWANTIDWQQTYNRAHRTNDHRAACYALLHLTLERSKLFRLSRSDIRGIQAYSRSLKNWKLFDTYRAEDVVFVVAHGQPSDFKTGQEQLSQNSATQMCKNLKLRCLLVFISCDFGDKNSWLQKDEEEAWIKLSNAHLQEGRAIAAATIITAATQLKNPPPPEALVLSKFLEYFIPAVQSFEQTIYGQAPTLLRILARYSRIYGQETGFRVYDTQQKTITLWRSIGRKD